MAKRFLSFEDRKTIEKGLKEGLSYAQLSRDTGFHHTSIRYEVMLNSENGKYTAEGALRQIKARSIGPRWGEDDLFDRKEE
jgi:IS30 family transposase